MSDPAVAQAQDWLRQHESDLLEDTLKMLRIPSVQSSPEANAPFGAANRQALDFALRLGKEWGFRSKDLDGYAGFVEAGEGERLVVALCHLDVVPVGERWKKDPFGAAIEGGYVYARGSCDDKGPTMAMFYAARALKEAAPDLGARIRVVFGCNEESGMECIRRYNATEEQPTFGVAPDASWPLIRGEKGIANLTILATPPEASVRITELSGGQRPNIVIDRATALVSVNQGAKSAMETSVADAWDRNLNFAWTEQGTLRIDAVGQAAHGSYPHGGDSAATRLFRFLADAAPLDCQEFYRRLLDSTQISGVGLGIHGRDEESGDLTCNLGVATSQQGVLKLVFNVRYPVTWIGDSLRERCEKHMGEMDGFRLADFSDSPPLHFPLDHPMVRAICDVVRQETGETKPPATMGGGTYARMMKNTVAIGTGWDGDGRAHEPDERLKVDHLFRMSRVYAHILHKLATLAGPQIQ